MNNIEKALNLLRKNKTSAWSGYNQPYIQNIVKGGLKALTLLATLTFDFKLLFWVKGLQGHLEKQMAEAEAEVNRYKF